MLMKLNLILPTLHIGKRVGRIGSPDFLLPIHLNGIPVLLPGLRYLLNPILTQRNTRLWLLYRRQQWWFDLDGCHRSCSTFLSWLKMVIFHFSVVFFNDFPFTDEDCFKVVLIEAEGDGWSTPAFPAVSHDGLQRLNFIVWIASHWVFVLVGFDVIVGVDGGVEEMVVLLIHVFNNYNSIYYRKIWLKSD